MNPTEIGVDGIACRSWRNAVTRHFLRVEPIDFKRSRISDNRLFGNRQVAEAARLRSRGRLSLNYGGADRVRPFRCLRPQHCLNILVRTMPNQAVDRKPSLREVRCEHNPLQGAFGVTIYDFVFVALTPAAGAIVTERYDAHTLDR